MAQKLPAHEYLLNQLRTIINKIRDFDPLKIFSEFEIIHYKIQIDFICNTLLSIHIPEEVQDEVNEAMRGIYNQSLGLAEVGGINFQSLIERTMSVLPGSGKDDD